MNKYNKKKINVADVLYLELYDYETEGYIYSALCFVLTSLKKSEHQYARFF